MTLRIPSRLLHPLRASLVIALLTSLGGCERPDAGEADAGQEEEEKAAPVVVAPVLQSSISAKIRSASTIEAERSVTVHSESMGRIRKIAFEEGQAISKGDLLAQIDRDAQSSGVERAATNLEKSQADLARVQSLFDRGAASKEELDNAKTAVRTSKLDRRDRRRELGDTRVVAPFAGVVTERLVNEGAYVTSGQQLFTITDFETLVARVYVPEKELDRIRLDQSAEIVGKAAKGRAATGKVVRIAPVVDAATGTVKVTVSLPPPSAPSSPAAQGAPPETAGPRDGFLPGMYAEVTLTTEQKLNVTVVPKPALVREEERTFVFVVEGDRAKRKLLKTGLESEDFVEVLEGVELGQQIILAGQTGLKDGALIVKVDLAGNPVDAADTDTDEGVASR